MVAYRVDRPRYSAGISWSGDGGVNWQTTTLPLPPGKDRPYAPDVAFGPDGTLYVLYVNLEGRGNDPENLWLARSLDGGRTIQAPTRVAGRLTFQPRLAVDRAAVVHVVWTAAENVGNLSIVGPTTVVSSHSTDGGATFSPPIVVSDPGRERVGAATPVVDGRGRLIVLYEDFKDDSRDYQGLEGPTWEGNFALVVSRSDDGGRSFGPGVEAEPGVVPAHRFLVYQPEFPSVAAGDGERLYLAWTDGGGGTERVMVRPSSDGGRTWGPAVRVADHAPADHTSQFLPAISATGASRVDVVFLDRRRDPANVMTDAYLATSVNGGRSFRSRRLSSAAFDSRVGPANATYPGTDFGSRLGISSVSGTALAAWTDTRYGTRDTGRQDIITARVAH
ncbi:MAG: hypothetical protein NVSMB16_08800 [Acidimicrobiales bacterium]